MTVKWRLNRIEAHHTRKEQGSHAKYCTPVHPSPKWCTLLDGTGLVLPHSWGSMAKAMLFCPVQFSRTQPLVVRSSLWCRLSSVFVVFHVSLCLQYGREWWRCRDCLLSPHAQKYRSFICCMSFSSRALVSSSSRMDWLVLWSFQLIFSILLYAVILNPAILSLSLDFNVHDSHP